MIIEKGKEAGILKDKEAKYLVPKEPRVSTVYYLPKIHKGAQKTPGRPIVSGIISFYFSRIGEYIDYFLQEIVIANDSYLKDSDELIKILNSNAYKEGCHLVKVYVNSLYTSIN